MFLTLRAIMVKRMLQRLGASVLVLSLALS